MTRKTDPWRKDSKPKCRILPSPPSKIHQLHYLTVPAPAEKTCEILAVSTEDGRVLFYSTTLTEKAEKGKNEVGTEIPNVQAIGQVGGNFDDLKGRIKDFDILRLPAVDGSTENLLVVAGSSEGAIRLWLLDPTRLMAENANLVRSPNSGLDDLPNGKGEANILKRPSIPQIGQLVGVYETGNRITCLKAFVMSNPNDPTNVVVKDKGVIPDLGGTEAQSNDSTSS